MVVDIPEVYRGDNANVQLMTKNCGAQAAVLLNRFPSQDYGYSSLIMLNSEATIPLGFNGSD